MSDAAVEEVDVRQLYTDLSDIKEMLTQVQATLSELTEFSQKEARTDHPYIARIEGVSGGRPMVSGTRISVRTIVERVQLGDSPEQIVKDYPPLNLAQVYDALSYYHKHRAEMEGEIAANEEALAWVTNHRDR